MKLYCLRHGEAESAEVDPSRPLTSKGREQAERVARHLYHHHIHISHVMHSPQRRAAETAEIFSNEMKLTHVTECDSILDEDADVEILMDMIATWTDDTLLVGHLPFMPRLISGLVIGNPDLYPIVNYPPAGIVCLEHYDQARWIIQWILNPYLLGV